MLPICCHQSDCCSSTAIKTIAARPLPAAKRLLVILPAKRLLSIHYQQSDCCSSTATAAGDVFAAFDLDGDGFVESAELMQLGGKHNEMQGRQWTSAQNEALVNSLDSNQDGQVQHCLTDGIYCGTDLLSHCHTRLHRMPHWLTFLNPDTLALCHIVTLSLAHCLSLAHFLNPDGDWLSVTLAHCD